MTIANYTEMWNDPENDSLSGGTSLHRKYVGEPLPISVNFIPQGDWAVGTGENWAQASYLRSDKMADELVLHVYYDEEDGFMVSAIARTSACFLMAGFKRELLCRQVPISKSKPVAALRSEIEIVAQENSAENSPDQQR